MSAKKKHRKKQPVERVLVRPAVPNGKRVVTEVPEGTEGAIAVKQDDGSTKHFVVTREEIPAVYRQGRATGPTTRYGKRNVPDHMVPKGKSEKK